MSGDERRRAPQHSVHKEQAASAGGWVRIGSMHMPADMADAVSQSIAREAQRLLATEGLRAFEMPRSAALAHETGHAVVGTAVGLEIVSVEVFKRDTPFGPAWGGETNEAAPWHFSDTTPVKVILNRIFFILAGIAGEMVLDPAECRSGSSLNEVVVAQMICAGLVQDHGAEFSDPKEVWKTCWAKTCGIIKRNEAAALSLMRKLDRAERLHGKPLAASLRRVRG